MTRTFMIVATAVLSTAGWVVHAQQNPQPFPRTGGQPMHGCCCMMGMMGGQTGKMQGQDEQRGMMGSSQNMQGGMMGGRQPMPQPPSR